MGEDLPLVSIGLQFYNNERTLRIAIKSIINQTYTNWELLLYNDGSTDNSLEIAESFNDDRIRTFSDEVNKGRPRRINQTLALCKGKYFALMDGDDVSYPQRVEKQVTFLEQNPEVDLVGARMIVFSKDYVVIGTRNPPANHECICRKPQSGFHMAQPTFMGKLEWFKQHKYCEEITRSMIEDQDLLMRTYESSRFANLQEILLGYREEELRVKRILMARRDILTKRSKYFLCSKKIRLALMTIVNQVAKGIVDIVAVSTGLNYRLLRHRALPASNQEIEEWERIILSVKGD
jgi:glycosyltransferase involved in cell wall biosynthesis